VREHCVVIHNHDNSFNSKNLWKDESLGTVTSRDNFQAFEREKKKVKTNFRTLSAFQNCTEFQ
jgi:hypothetical protein